MRRLTSRTKRYMGYRAAAGQQEAYDTIRASIGELMTGLEAIQNVFSAFKRAGKQVNAQIPEADWPTVLGEDVARIYTQLHTAINQETSPALWEVERIAGNVLNAIKNAEGRS